MIRAAMTVAVSAAICTAATFSRDQLIRHAIDSSESVVQIRTEQQSAVSIRKEYFGKGLPTIDGVVNLEHKLKSYNPYDFKLGGNGGTVTSALKTDADINDTILAGTIDKLMAGFSTIDLSPKKNTAAMGVKFTQPIFAQGKVVTGLRIADAYYESLEQKMEAEQIRLAKEITISWYGAVLADENLQIRQEAAAISEESHRLAVARFIAGKGTQIDTMNTRYAVQEARAAVRLAAKDRRLAVEKMITVASVGIDPDSVALDESLEPIAFTLTEEEAAAKLEKNNRSVTQLDRATRLQELQTTLAKSDFLPTVYAGGQFMAISMYNDVDKIEFGGDHKIFAGVSVPLFSGGQRLHKLHQAGYAEQKLSAQKSDAVKMLRLALSAQYEELAVAQEEYAEAQEMVALTEKARTVSAKAFEVGQIRQLDLTTSEQNARMAKLAQNAAVYRINAAVTSIRELIGDETLMR